MPKPKDPDPYPKVPPFIAKKPQPRKNGVDMRGLLSLALMVVSLGALSLAMGGAAIMVYGVLKDGISNSLDGLWAKVIVLGLTDLFGWGVALISIRGFGNLIYPIIIKIYAWACLSAVGMLYLKVIQKLYLQQYDFTRFCAYVLTLVGGLIVLIGLHLLIEGHDLRPFAIPLLLISVFQLFVILMRYVFMEGAQATRLWGDLTIFFLMIGIATLMLMHLGLLAGIRSQIDSWFHHNHNGNHKPKNEETHWVQ